MYKNTVLHKQSTVSVVISTASPLKAQSATGIMRNQVAVSIQRAGWMPKQCDKKGHILQGQTKERRKRRKNSKMKVYFLKLGKSLNILLDILIQKVG